MADTSGSTATHYVSLLRWASLKRAFLSRQSAPSAAPIGERR
ncbi:MULTISPECIES: hypothetical protein [unclassified Cryobacterium]|nr:MULTISPECIES: hypothetical protein [unclassified Cryobacterium]